MLPNLSFYSGNLLSNTPFTATTGILTAYIMVSLDSRPNP